MWRFAWIRIVAVAAITVVVCSQVRATQAEGGRRNWRDRRLLRLCLPAELGADDASVALRALLDDFETLPGVRIDLSYGSEYQILDWLQRDEVDAASLSPLGVYLLRRGRWVSEAGAGDAQAQADGPYLFFRPDGSNPTAELPLMLRAVESNASADWTARADPSADFEALLEELWVEASTTGDVHASHTERTVLLMPSHLSTAGFAAALRRATEFLHARQAADRSRNDGEAADAAKRFWRSFFDHARFLIVPTPVAWNASAVERFHLFDEQEPVVRRMIEFRDDVGEWRETDGWKSYRLSAEGMIAASAPNRQNGNFVVVRRTLAGATPKFTGYVSDAQLARDVQLEPARQALSGSGAEIPWVFSFKIPELLRLIDVDQQSSKLANLALVLPGGGVKACYQSTLIDHLYQNKFLVNGERSAAAEGALAVGCVTGNSGGALLGSFVAGLGDERQSLSKLLWFENDRPLDSLAVFPFWDLPRWLTVFACCAVFCIVLSAAFWITRKRRLGRAAESGQSDTRSRFWYSMTWVVFLVLIPFGFKFVNGSFGVEHVPAQAGFVYFFCLCIAIAGDNCFLFCAGDRSKPWRFFKLNAVLLLAGIAAIVVAIVFRWKPSSSDPLGEEVPSLGMPWPSVVFCVGALLLLSVRVLWMFDNPHRFKQHKTWEFLKGFLLVLAVPVVTTAVLFVRNSLGHETLMELTGSFWRALCVTAFLVSLALLLVGTLARGHWRWAARLHAQLEYLCSVHPSGSLNAPRVVRFVAFGLFGWSWWNFVVAPAVYGNHNASDYFGARLARFYKIESDSLAGQRAQLRTSLIVPATALLADEERYFLFSPTSDQKFFDDAVARLSRDPRWRGYVGEISLPFLKDVVFASGSPFPIFPAHKIDYTPRGQEVLALGPAQPRPEWLIDGGFAHNVPIEAARLAGARQILVVENEPRDPPPSIARQQLVLQAKYASAHIAEPSGSADDEEDLYRSFQSQLVANLPRVLPFLLKRSQLADDLSRKGLFVAALEPSFAESWPILTDFRSNEVQHLRTAAEADRQRRVGVVQSWGTPQFFRPPAR